MWFGLSEWKSGYKSYFKSSSYCSLESPKCTPSSVSRPGQGILVAAGQCRNREEREARSSRAARRIAASSSVPPGTCTLFLLRWRRGPAPGPLERDDSTDLRPERRVSRPGAGWFAQEEGPRSGLCLGLPGLVQSRAASLSGRADLGGFRDFAGALEPNPREEEAGSLRDQFAVQGWSPGKRLRSRSM